MDSGCLRLKQQSNKMDKQQELNDLFSLFHDFEITLLTYQKNTLNLTITIPWGEVWNDWNYQIRLELAGCDFFQCDYSEFIDGDNLSSDRKTIDKTTNDPSTISDLGLEIQSHTYAPPNKYAFKCNSSRNCAGGLLTFSADDYKLFNAEGVPIDLTQMNKWSTDWWEKIRKMWDENEQRLAQNTLQKSERKWWQKLFGC
jgi:hypothetical protein